jgi:catechol 2,3-dioxygenase-like lactoylglutathione lyase family enzyme
MDLNQITMPSTDLGSSVEFYQKLGLQLIVDALPRYARFQLPNGTSTLSLHKTDKRFSNSDVTVYFECEDLDNKVQDLISEGIEFDLLPTDQSWLWREARLSDPDGNKLILYFAGKNRLNPPWRIN